MGFADELKSGKFRQEKQERELAKKEKELAKKMNS